MTAPKTSWKKKLLFVRSLKCISQRTVEQLEARVCHCLLLCHSSFISCDSFKFLSALWSANYAQHQLTGQPVTVLIFRGELCKILTWWLPLLMPARDQRNNWSDLIIIVSCWKTCTGWPNKFGTIILYALTLPNINRFSKLFYYQNQEKICNNTTTKDLSTPQVCRYI